MAYTDGSASSALELAKAYTNQQVEGIEVPTKTSQLENDSGYLTKHQSLDGYATEKWVEDKGYLTEHQSLEGYATEQWVEDKNYLTQHQDLSEYAKKNELPTVPTNVSAFENDKGYLTSLGADYVLEKGTTNGWNWEKWNSGIVVNTFAMEYLRTLVLITQQ